MNQRFGVLNTIKAYKTLCETENFTSLFSSIPSMNLDDDNLLPFLIDLYIIVTENDDVGGLITKFLTSSFSNFVEIGQKSLNSIAYNTKFINKKVSDLNISGGTLQYQSIDFSNNIKNKDFDKMSDFEKVIFNSYTTDGFLDYSGIQLKLKKDNSLEYKFTNGSNNIKDIIDGLSNKIIPNLTDFLRVLLNLIFNTTQNESLKNMLLDKVFSDDNFKSDNFNFEDFTSVFINDNKLKIKNTAECLDGNSNFIINFQDFEPSIISGANDFENNIFNTVSEITSNNNTAKDLNKNLLKKLIYAFIDALLFQPQSVFLILMVKNLDITDKIGYNNIIEYFNDNSENFECLINELKEEFFNFIIDEIEDSLTEIISCLILEFGKEKAEMYIQSLKTLLF